MSSRFRFRGTAFGVAGSFTYPFQELIEVQASSSLPDIGGYGSSRVCNFQHRDILRFDLAHTEVIGTTHDPDTDKTTYSTRAQSTIEGFNLMDMVTADRIVANITSSYDPNGAGEPRVKLIGSRFENLKIAGIPIKVELAVDTFDKYPTYQLLAEKYEAKDDDGQHVRDLFDDITLKKRYNEAPPKVARWFNPPRQDNTKMPEHKGVTSVSLIKKLTPMDAGAGLDCFGHVIHVSGFGTIRLAEVGISSATRAVTMLQVNLGSPAGGRVSGGGADDGGTTW